MRRRETIMIKKIVFGIVVVAICLLTFAANADEVFKFKNPSFSGIGTGAHYLTIENQEFSRTKSIKDAIEAARKAAEREESNSTLAKFMRNLESRIYAQFAKQLVDSMFSNDDPSTFGTFTLEGSVITWELVPGVEGSPDFIRLTVVDEFGSETIIEIPVGTGFYSQDSDTGGDGSGDSG
jgi:hypothetical protein